MSASRNAPTTPSPWGWRSTRSSLPCAPSAWGISTNRNARSSVRLNASSSIWTTRKTTTCCWPSTSTLRQRLKGPAPASQRGPQHPACFGMHLDQPAWLLQELREPGRRQVAFIDHIDTLAAHFGNTTYAIVVLDDVQRNVQAQHAGRAQDQISQVHFHRNLGKSGAFAGAQPIGRRVYNQPTLVIACR